MWGQRCFINTFSTYMKLGADSGLRGAATPMRWGHQPITTVRKFAKMLFLHLSVILSTVGRGVCLSACWDTPHPPGQTPPLGRHHPLGRNPPPPKFHSFTLRISFLRKLTIFFFFFCIFALFLCSANSKTFRGSWHTPIGNGPPSSSEISWIHHW